MPASGIASGTRTKTSTSTSTTISQSRLARPAASREKETKRTSPDPHREQKRKIPEEWKGSTWMPAATRGTEARKIIQACPALPCPALPCLVYYCIQSRSPHPGSDCSDRDRGQGQGHGSILFVCRSRGRGKDWGCDATDALTVSRSLGSVGEIETKERCGKGNENYFSELGGCEMSLFVP